ncbi:MAG TPA: AlkA N-terminal domain-containing protein [Solirubrobacteraceae bacterium]|jgi:AraC family transcriptional regulator of adaptative response / DNA-3-methyladenine glycosylase II
MYTLIGPDGAAHRSRSPGTLGGHRRNRGYGRLDCPAALRWIAKGHYVRHRVFFADEATALAAGYRPCATCLPHRYAAWKAGRIEVELRPRGVFDAGHMLGFLAARAVPGVEAVEGRVYRRSLALAGGPATVSLAFAARRVRASFGVADRRDVHEALRRVRRLLDLDADMAGVRRALGPLARERPGIRSPGAVDAEEIAIRAVVGQQVSVAGARTVLGRLTAAHGEPVATGLPGVTHLFPRAAALAGADLPMPRARARAVAALAGVDPAADDLTAIPGIGRWTAQYVAMRLGDPDVLLTTDLVVRRALAALPPGTDPDGWRPYRSYATHQLWAAGV